MPDLPPLALDSSQWGSLEDAYGSAGRIPELLLAVEQQDEDALAELFSRLCHQMSVYSSSIAVLPHLAALASRLIADPKIHVDILCLAGAICESREFPRELEQSGHAGAAMASVPMLADLARKALRRSPDPEEAIYLLKSLAAFSGRQPLARVLDGIPSEEFTVQCPACATELYVWPSGHGLSVAAQDPVSHADTRRTMVRPASAGPFPEQRQWLDQQAAATAALANVRALSPSLFGTASCAACGKEFDLFDALAAQNA